MKIPSHHHALRSALLLSTAILGVAVGTSAVAQDAPAAAPPVAGQAADPQGAVDQDVADIVVTGQRLGFSTTSQIKRDAPQSVSVLTTTDLRNIPDTVLIDIVRRVPGLQVSQGGGGGIVSIRGLSQTENRLNGRNFPSALGRNFDIATLPGDLVSGVAVYKTPTADQIEGGIGGVIDFRTRRPFDFDGYAGSLTAKGVYTNLDDKIDPVISGYIGNRWETGIGDVGIMVGGSFQRQRNALHLLTADGNRTPTTGAAAGINAPTNVWKRYFENTKELTTVYGSLQWRPSPSLEMVVDVLYNDSVNQGGLQNLGAFLNQGTAVLPFSVYDSSNIFRSGRYTNVPVESSTSTFGGSLDALQVGYNATWKDDRATVVADVAYTRSTNRNSGGFLAMQTTAPQVAYDAGSSFPGAVLTGVDPTVLANYRYTGFNEYRNDENGDDLAARLDGTYTLDGAIRTLQFGVRYDRRSVDRQTGFRPANLPTTLPSVTSNPFVELTPDDLYKDDGLEQRRWATFSYRALRGGGLAQSRALFGVAGAVPLNPAQAYSGKEESYTSYGMATFAFPIVGLPVDGNVGVRIVKTDLSIDATLTQPNGTLVPDSRTTSYVDVLPSVNLRFTLAPELFLRLAYSKQLTRPSFGQLAPVATLSLGGTTANNTGASGNPDLLPLRADQFDASLEHYFGRDNSVYVAGFYKDVRGFIRNETVTQIIGGQSFLITRPQNLDKGYVAGAEVGYRQTFSFLPGALSGLGVQGSYTYVNGTRAPNNAGIVVPYEQITKHNYQISGFFNKYGISANVNWVWRSRLLEAASGNAAGQPDYRIPFGQLDANLIYALTPKVNLIVSGVNLTQSLIRRSFQDTRYFAQNALENRRILAGVQIKLGGGI